VKALSAAKRIYVRLPNWVGDVVLATPFLQALRRAAPGAQVVLHGKKHALPILAAEGLHDVALPLGPGKGLFALVGEGRRVRREAGEFDVAFVLPNSFSSAVIARATGARERVGYSLNARGLLLSEALFAKKEGRLRPTPMVDYYLKLAEVAGAKIDDLKRCPRLTVTPEQDARADAFLRAQGVPEGARPWAMNIGGSWETKRWIPEHAGQLARLLEASGRVPLLLTGPDERDLAARAVTAAGKAFPGSNDVVPLTDLAAVLRRCEVFVTTDSGPRHFGIAAGVPVLVLIGSTHPGYTQVDYDRLDLLCEKVECWPCHLKRCPIDFRCMTRLGPERVLAAAEALLTRVRGAA
jgi:heptosyltransferase-2